MLVLTRRPEESILIGPDIEVKVLQVRGGGEQATVRIGIVAPRSVPVVRKELHDAVAAENRRAAAGTGAAQPLQVPRVAAGGGKRRPLSDLDAIAAPAQGHGLSAQEGRDIT